MKKFLISLWIGSTGMLISCSSHQQTTNPPASADIITATPKDNFPTDTLIGSVQSRNDLNQSFALYLPPNYNDSARLPVMIFFDPHGSGSFPLSKYKNLARRFGVVLLGSNSSRNGIPNDQTDAIAANMISEAPLRFSVNPKRIILAGFSGGAKVAMDNASHNPAVSSLIYGGAFSDHPPTSIPLLGFAGVSDMNYSDLLSFDQSLGSGFNHLLIEWNGKHEWPDSSVFEDAFYWSAFNAMRSKIVFTNQNLVARFLNENNKMLAAQSDLVKQAAICRKVIYFLSGIEDVSSYAQKLASIQQNPDYLKQMAEKNQILNEERGLKQQYMNDFTQKELDWWKQELARMRSVSDPKQKAMYQRLLGFISLGSNTLSMRAMKSDQMDAAEKMLALYQLADPKNPEVEILQADFFAKKGDNTKAIQSLQKAVQLGWKDSTRVITEPFLIPLHDDTDFKKVVSEMK